MEMTSSLLQWLQWRLCMNSDFYLTPSNQLEPTYELILTNVLSPTFDLLNHL